MLAGLLRALLLLMVSGACVAGASSGVAPSTSGHGPTESPSTVSSAAPSLRVAAAADLALAFEEIGSKFGQEHGVKVDLIFGSSGQLRDQIANGAPFDVFASANLAYVEELARRGLVVPDSVKVYALGRLALAWNERYGYDLAQLQDLRGIRFRALVLANPDHAPYGVAAKEALQRAGLWPELEAKVVYSENIRQTVQFIQTGAAEVGLIALSLANSPGIRYVEVDRSLYSPLRQGIGVVTSTRQPRLAEQWIDFLLSSRGQEIMKRYGFGSPD